MEGDWIVVVGKLFLRELFMLGRRYFHCIIFSCGGHARWLDLLLLLVAGRYEC